MTASITAFPGLSGAALSPRPAPSGSVSLEGATRSDVSGEISDGGSRSAITHDLSRVIQQRLFDAAYKAALTTKVPLTHTPEWQAYVRASRGPQPTPHFNINSLDDDRLRPVDPISEIDQEGDMGREHFDNLRDGGER